MEKSLNMKLKLEKLMKIELTVQEVAFIIKLMRDATKELNESAEEANDFDGLQKAFVANFLIDLRMKIQEQAKKIIDSPAFEA